MAKPNSSDCESINVCGSKKVICIKETDTMETYSEIEAAANYDLFFCGTPDKEPTCIPMRPREQDTVYNGNGTSQYGVQSYLDNAYYSDPEDVDGDGIPNENDNCPSMFNPVRPQYSPVTLELYDEQPDTDGDGMGDICDPYPTCAENDSSCPVFDPNDRDSDGIPNASDNCPNQSNPDQTDTDEDGLGDVCDACPEDGNNEDGNGCSFAITNIQDIRYAHIAGTLVEGGIKTRGVVTAIVHRYDGSGLTGFFIQDESNPAGLLVYSATEAANVAVGDLVEVRGNLEVYYSIVEIKPNNVKVLSHNHTIEPIVLTAAQTTANTDETGTTNPYDSVLVTVSGLTVNEYDVSIHSGESYVCSDAEGTTAYLDDYVMGLNAFNEIMSVGTTYDATGILIYDHSRSKIAPRFAGDLFAPFVSFEVKSLTAVPLAAWGSEVEVTLTMSKPAEAATTVAISCGSGVCPASVTIPAGETSARFDVTMAASGDTTVTATYNGNSKEVTIIGKDVNPFDVAYSMTFEEPTGNGYLSTYSYIFENGVEVSCQGQFDDGNHRDDMVMTGNYTKQSFFSVSGLEGVGNVTIYYDAWINTVYGTMELVIGSDVIEYTFSKDDINKELIMTVGDSEATSFTIRPKAGTNENNSNRIVIHRVDWTSAK